MLATTKTPARRPAVNVAQFSALIALLGLVLFNVVTTPNFLTLNTLNINMTQTATILIVAVGMTYVIATGGIDLSVGSIMAISGAIAPLLFLNAHLSPGVALGLAVLLPLTAAGLCGVFNGLLVTRFHVQPIIATLVLFIAGRGIAQVISGGALVNFPPSTFTFLGTARFFGVNIQVFLMLLILAVATWVLRSTLFGRHVVAVGGNAQAAWLSGVPVARTRVAVYAISGMLAGLAGLITIAVNNSSDANLVGQNMELDAIAAVAVGGTALSGGKVTLFGTLVGALFIQLLRYTLLVKGMPDAAALIVKAAIIIAAVALQYRRK
ncbi:ABC transporter permease [Deinococcus maricopensis]|uniref:ABC-type transporter, integral membrane subunit n=1 Tax=Deinococcus maricopensis (strain DSM 21211 / LMG 22137 / NRRL B-23946 / LB-34) TaxID=709986 RepID=E8U481_DEIML|nr:ABC transporter permease [Deinococcus maricopensis]ADV65918.1 ABC-type transporter, integral membrane subunit [Deinococcus maricopensis DSM 21211]